MRREENKNWDIKHPEGLQGHPLKRRGLCLQAHASHSPCQYCEECIWVDQVPINKDYGDIVFIHAASACPATGVLEVKLDIRTMRGRWSRYRSWDAEGGVDEAALEEQVINMKPAALEGFINGLKDIGLLNWGEQYEADEGEGGEWVIRIEFNGFRIKKSGKNSYPRKWHAWCQLWNDYWQVEFR